MDNLKLDERLQKTVKEHFKFESWTPVQQATIPTFLAHQDVAVEACTGSGKTIAYMLPVFEMILRRLEEDAKVELGENPSKKKLWKQMQEKRKPPAQWSALIVSPTRELAQQIHKVAKPFADRVGLGTMLLTGGTSVLEDIERVQSEQVEIVIGTPGRVDDIMCRAHDNLSYRSFEVLILDEADVLLDMGFEKTVTSILGRLPKQRRTGLFSATQTKEVKNLIRAGLRNPAIISVQVQGLGSSDASQQKTPTTLQNFSLVCEQDEKIERLCNFLVANRDSKIITFFSTCASVAFFEAALGIVLKSQGIHISGLYGKMVQKKRTAIYEAFVARESGVLLCTDVAARGIDIPDVDWIIQFDPPQDPSFFVHRVGRTARAGRKGNALVFLLPKESAYIHLLESRKVPLQVYPNADALAESTAFEGWFDLVKGEMLKSRELLENGTKAFVAFMRAYKEHKMQFIFRLPDLNMRKVARSFVLLRIPNMTELRETKGIKGYEEVPVEIVNKIPFKNKARENQRLEKYKETQERLKKEREEKQTEKKRKLAEAKRKAEQPKRRKHSRHKAIVAEWNELAKEEKLHRNFRRGKISKDDYDSSFFSLNK